MIVVDRTWTSRLVSRDYTILSPLLSVIRPTYHIEGVYTQIIWPSTRTRSDDGQGRRDLEIGEVFLRFCAPLYESMRIRLNILPNKWDRQPRLPSCGYPAEFCWGMSSISYVWKVMQLVISRIWIVQLSSDSMSINTRAWTRIRRLISYLDQLCASESILLGKKAAAYPHSKRTRPFFLFSDSHNHHSSLIFLLYTFGVCLSSSWVISIGGRSHVSDRSIRDLSVRRGSINKSKWKRLQSRWS